MADTKAFIDLISPLAIEDMRTSGVLASVTTAQAILESGWGTSELALKANNYFGMKKELSGNTWPNSTWDGKSVYKILTSEQKSNGEVYKIEAYFRKYADILDSIRDHSAYLAGAKNGGNLRYPGLVGEKDYRKAIQIIKDGGYATSLTYVDKVCQIIEQYGLTQYDKKEEQKMEIVNSIMTENPCYTKGEKITVKGLMLHSVGCAQPNAMAFINNWNRSTYNSACVHGFIDANNGKAYQTLPWNYRGWHAAGAANNTHIGIEMCEPDCIKYKPNSAIFTCSDITRAQAMVTKTYNTAVLLFAMLCNEFSLDPLKEGVIVSHKEGHKRGIASNHADPEHLWTQLKLPYTMNTFREDVKAAMTGDIPKLPEKTPGAPEIPEKPLNMPNVPFMVEVIIDDLNYRSEGSMQGTIKGYTGKGIFTIVEVNKDNWGKLKSGAGWIYLGNPNYCTIGVQPNKCPYTVAVNIADLCIRTGPGTNYVWTGRYTGKGIFTIVEEKNGWGKLKSGAGWISLAYCTEV